MSTATIRQLGEVEYIETLDRMRAFNAKRDVDTGDELWVLEHPPVFTRGVSCRQSPHKNPRAIPVIDTDRGGQITYHGPGQLIVYLMLDIKKRRLGIRRLVSNIEQSIIETLAQIDIEASREAGAPGVYVDHRKIAALGLRVRNGFTYHGLSLNIDMDLEPFTWIDPCGYEGLETVDVSSLVDNWERDRIIDSLIHHLDQHIEVEHE